MFDDDRIDVSLHTARIKPTESYACHCLWKVQSVVPCTHPVSTDATTNEIKIVSKRDEHLNKKKNTKTVTFDLQTMLICYKRYLSTAMEQCKSYMHATTATSHSLCAIVRVEVK